MDALHKHFHSDISKFPESLVGKTYNGPVLFLAGTKSDFVKYEFSIQAS